MGNKSPTPDKRSPGRPPSLDKATKLATIKMTPAMHVEFLARGGGRWVKQLLSEGKPKQETQSAGFCRHGGQENLDLSRDME